MNAVFRGMEYSPPVLSSYRHERLVEPGIDTQATKIAYLVLCFACVMLIPIPLTI